MSNLLNEAIVDAKALKEAALKNAETSIIQKYSTEVKNTMDKLLEQDELGLGGGAPEPAGDLGGGGDLGGDLGGADPMAAEEAPAEDDVDPDDEIPFAAADNIPGMKSKESTTTEFDLDLGALEEAISELSNSLNEGQELEFDADMLAEAFSVDALEEVAVDPGVASAEETIAASEQDDDSDEGDLEEAYSSDEEELYEEELYEDTDLSDLVGAIAERLTVDMGADLSGWAGRSSSDQRREIELEMAHRRSTDVAEELEDLKKAQEELVFENKQLKEQLSQYKHATTELKEGLQDVNLSNARLLYTNRVLRNTSLNERQKERIVEAISRAGSVTEARTIFDTLQSTVEAKPKSSPKSLNEAITRRSSVIRASRHESTTSDPFSERMKRLAGIK
jgi:hypothetical protein